ncbi:ArsR family transcriptional regulator [Saccharopolyspora erythraea NRRL 2338]|uniref:Transcriptional regulator, ArsR family n=2 Tax=Saccharopolyspora erythraea TaxID=1836 RepID=A4FQ11_SACEN|nr:helix-turn-helix domain-containing protein [Saccharopolyspora erythraea]EQD84326.1 ArsR family transcriptional regulator [Saccharopolyspora erythraea D]PFG99781.1 ArsR family transcriptional regulator [Saccharopolyspora erythraea NRRL 2338]QRK89653.1 helix-turn-helix transcriptional regulator [Saccharopolyspora erythraea]CAM06136.1 transcriptional regulator, ArsR family [Saccharopolyspora erythraea NRRL 2338]
MAFHHPTREQIQLPDVLTALGHPVRLSIVRALAEGGEHSCGALPSPVSKSTMTHHWRVLRESGVIHQRPEGREHFLTLRCADLDARFPGLLHAILDAAKQPEAATPAAGG